MAASDYSIVPKTTTKTALTSAALALSSVSLLVPAFTVSANGGNSTRVYLGDSGVAASEGLPLNARESVSFPPFEHQKTKKSWYDLSQFYIRATAASQVVTVMVLNVKKDNA